MHPQGSSMTKDCWQPPHSISNLVTDVAFLILCGLNGASFISTSSAHLWYPQFFISSAQAAMPLRAMGSSNSNTMQSSFLLGLETLVTLYFWTRPSFLSLIDFLLKG